MKLLPLFLGAALVSIAIQPTLAARIGDPAPALKIKDWIKGEAVDVKDGKNVYVVEFWATWCGPCKTSIPHLTEMQKKFKDQGVVFVGISDEEAEKVKPFVEKMAAKMDYVVACDDGRKSYTGYMQAYGQSGIPSAFIVSKEGKVVWVGHPMADLESTLEKVLARTYDLAAAIKKDESRALNTEFAELSTKGDPKAKELGRKLIELAGDDVEALTQLAFGIAANARNTNRDFVLAEAALDKAEKKAGSTNAQVVGIRSVVRFESGKQDEGIALAKKAVELATEEREKAQFQNFLRVMESRKKAKTTAEPKSTDDKSTDEKK